MKQNRLFFITIATTILLLFGIGCDQGENPVQSFRDVVDKIPNLVPIAGAENVSKTVKTSFDESYFTVEIRNVAPGADIRDGVYNGWCAQMDVSITTDIETHGHQVFSTEQDGKYRYINYLLNKRRAYQDSYAGLTWREVQVAIWTILETNDFSLGRIESRIPGSVDGFNGDLVNTILSDVKKNGWKYKPEIGHIKANYINNENEQDTIVESCETAWAYGETTHIELQISGSWGWVFDYTVGDGTENDPVEQTLWAGAGQNDTTKGENVGKVSVWNDNDNIYVTYLTTGGWYMKNAQLYVGDTDPTTAAPGQFPHKQENLANLTEVPFVIENIYNNGTLLKIAAHADVCIEVE
jgi:hypothetical protein